MRRVSPQLQLTRAEVAASVFCKACAPGDAGVQFIAVLSCSHWQSAQLWYNSTVASLSNVLRGLFAWARMLAVPRPVDGYCKCALANLNAAQLAASPWHPMYKQT